MTSSERFPELSEEEIKNLVENICHRNLRMLQKGW